MARRSALQSMTLPAIAAGGLWLLVVALIALATLTGPPTSDPGDVFIPVTGFVVAFLWAIGWPLTLSVRKLPLDDPVGGTERLRLTYTLGCLFCLFHITVAFHVGHEWSHRKAFEHTERASGYGWGVYVNYLFAAVWVADAAWAWAALDHYLNRPRWVSWMVFGFLAFIVVNAAVVFGNGARRWVSLFVLAVSVALVLNDRRRPPVPATRG